jgi:hypothetical protein
LTLETDSQFAQFQQGERTMRLPNIRRPFVLIAGLVLVVAAIWLMLLAKPKPADAVAIFLDASHSVGVDYRNRYIPVVTLLLPHLVDKNLRIVRFGGVWHEIFQGRPRQEDVNALREFLLKTDVFPAHVVGSPISSATLEGISWLSQQRGRRRVLLVFTDGVEQEDQTAQSQRVPRIGENLTVIFCFTRMSNPVSAEVAKLTGASVKIATDESTVQRYINQLVFDVHPHHMVGRAVAVCLAAVGLVLVCLALIPLLREKRPAQDTDETGAAQEEVLPTLPALDVEVTAQVVGQPHLRARRLLRRGDRFIIARQGVPDADLVLPLTLLGRFADFGIICQLEDGLTLRVHNFGRVPCIIGSLPLHPRETQQVDEASFLVRIPATDVEIAVTTQPAP